MAFYLVLSFASTGMGRQLSAVELPPGTVLQVRLRQPVSSYSSKRGQVLHGVLIAPVENEEAILLPPGTEVLGRVERVRRVGLGLIRERAHVRLSFDRLAVPDYGELSMRSRVFEVENARESVRPDGKIQGVRATGSLAYRASGLFVTVSAFDPLLMLFAFSSSSSILRFPDSEIYYPAGTELALKLSEPLSIAKTYPPGVPPLTTSAAEKEQLDALVAKLPFRTRTQNDNTPSDITNLIFLGSESQVERAFAAAGWLKSEELNAHTKYRTIRAAAEGRGYAGAPMSVLLLDEQIPHLTFEKALNTVAKRHHLRVWDLRDSWKGQPVWTSSSTRDIGVAFFKHGKKVIHLIEHNIDNERAKIVNDLIFTNCVAAFELVERPHVPRDARNATGEPLLTDGRIAVLQLNACDAPHLVAEDADPRLIRSRGNLLQRGGRQFFLSVHNDLIRNNLGWQAYTGIRLAVKKLRAHKPGPETIPQQARALVHTDKTGTSLLPPRGTPASGDTPQNGPPETKESPDLQPATGLPQADRPPAR